MEKYAKYCISAVIGFFATLTRQYGLIIGTYITLNECISICENLYECNPDIIPKWIAGMLKNAREKISDKESKK